MEIDDDIDDTMRQKGWIPRGDDRGYRIYSKPVVDDDGNPIILMGEEGFAYGEDKSLESKLKAVEQIWEFIQDGGGTFRTMCDYLDLGYVDLYDSRGMDLCNWINSAEVKKIDPEQLEKNREAKVKEFYAAIAEKEKLSQSPNPVSSQ